MLHASNHREGWIGRTAGRRPGASAASILRLAVAIVLPMAFGQPGAASAKTCSCKASFQVRHEFPRTPLFTADAPRDHFTSLQSRAPLQTRNACRRDARDKVHTCMDRLWKNRWTPENKPPECGTHTGIRGLVPYDVKGEIERAACRTGSPLATRHNATVRIHRRTHGDRGCGPKLQRSRSVFISNYVVDCPSIRSRDRLGMVGETEVKGIDRPGSDFPGTNGVTVGNGSVAACRAACNLRTGCRAWTWVPPGVQGKESACWLKNAVPWHRVHATSTGMVSGTRQHNSQ